MKNIISLIIAFLILHPGFTSSQWINQNPGTGLNINAVDFISANTGWAAGDNSKVYRTTNGGLNWSIITIPGNPVNITHAVAKEIDKMFVGTKNLIFGTTNGGVNWVQTVLGAHYEIGDMCEQGGSLYTAAYALNNAEDTILNAAIFRSTNNGINWSQISSIAMNTAGDPIHGVDIKLGIHFVSNDTGYVATVKGIYKTVNAGQSYVSLPGAPLFPQVLGYVGGIGTVCGSGGNAKLEIYNTTNGGTNWILRSVILNPTETKQFTSISCPDNTDKIYMTISSSNPGLNPVQDTSVYYSSNGGANWYYQTLPVNNINIYSIDFADGNTGYIAGSNGTILKTTNGGSIAGIHQISNEVPSQFELHQNYPNPFNPVTNIKFDVTSKGIVRLTIYDVTGREISVLVNQELQAGSYNADWNASDNPSGVYFYKLETAGFTETKKMILVK